MTAERNPPPLSKKSTRIILIGVALALFAGIYLLRGMPFFGHWFFQVFFGLVGVLLLVSAYLEFKRDGVFNKGTSKTQGVITNRFIKQDVSGGQDGGSVHEYYYVEVRYTPSSAKLNKGEVTLQANVAKKVYKSLEGKTTVNLEYALEDPLMFKIEGE
jgi:hypothetical protein